MAKESISGSLLSSATRVLMRIAFRFEPLAPTAITLYLNQQLSRHREEGAICDYKTHTRRLGKYHYRIEVDLDLNGGQAKYLMQNVFPKQIDGLRRWFYG